MGITYSSTQEEFAVTNPTSGTKVTILLDSSGDIKLSSGKSKLVAQLVRSLINDSSPLKDLINKKVSPSVISATITAILRSFKNTQLDIVNGQDTQVLGYKLYRKASGVNEQYKSVSNSVIQWKYVDLDLINNNTYSYGLVKVYSSGAESTFVDNIDVTPTATVSKQAVIIGTSGTFIAGNRIVTLYTDYNLMFNRSELLNDIINIEVTQNKQDPRRYNALVTVADMADNTVTISAQRLNPVTLSPIV
jgi:hypothetical protein